MAFEAGAVLVRVIPDMSGFAAGVQAGTAGIRAKTAALGSAMTRGITVPVLAAAAVSTKLAMDYGAAFKKIENLVGISGHALESLKEQTLDLAREGAESPKELADALFFITSAGFRGKDAMLALKASAEASAIGLGEVKVVADAVTSAVNAYGKENLTAAMSTDILASTVKAGKVEADAVAGSIGKVIPVAAAVGVEFHEVGAAIASMTRTGSNAPQAVTAISGALSAIIKPTETTRDALDELGFGIDEVRTSLTEKGLFPTFMKLKGLIGDDMDILGKLFPNKRAQLAFLSISGKNAEENSQIFQDLAHSSGLVGEGFENIQDSAGFQLKNAMANLQSTAIQFGMIFLPIVAEIGKAIGAVGAWVGGLSDETKRAIVAIAGVFAVIGPTILLVLKLATPVGLALTALSIAAAFVAKNWEDIEPILKSVARVIREVFTETVAKVKEFISVIFGAVPSLEDLKRTALEVWGTVTAFIASAVQTIRRIVQTLTDFFSGTLMPIFMAVWDIAKGVFGFFKDDVVDIINAVWDVIQTLASVIMENLWPALLSIWRSLKSLWPVIKIIGMGLGFVAAVVLKVALFLIKLSLRVLPIVIRVIGLVIQIIAKVISIIAAVVGAIARFIIAAGKVGAKVGGFFVDAWLAVKGAWDGVAGFFSSVFRSIMNFMITFFVNPFIAAVNLIIDAINLVLSAVDAIPFVDVGRVARMQKMSVQADTSAAVAADTGGQASATYAKGGYIPRGQIVRNATLHGPEWIIPEDEMGRGRGKGGKQAIKLVMDDGTTFNAYIEQLVSGMGGRR